MERVESGRDLKKS